MTQGVRQSGSDDPDDLAFPDDQFCGPWEDYSPGGIDLEDVSEGLRYQAWRFAYDGATVSVAPLTDDGPGEATALLALADVVEIAGAFDPSMYPIIATQAEAGVIHLRWYDALLSAYAVLSLDGASPRLTLDDTCVGLAGRDAWIFYLRDAVLYARRWSERFAEEHAVLAVDAAVTACLSGRQALGRCGVSVGGAVQVELTGAAL